MEIKGDVVIRPMQKRDLDAANAVIESCVMGWNLPDRVKRLSLRSYRYTAYDLAHFEIVLAESSGAGVTGVAAWEPAAPADLPDDQSGLLLHGLYVSPQFQNHGIGGLLVSAALAAVRREAMNGLLVKAQADASGYFRSHGFIRLPVENEKRDYPHRWWLPIAQMPLSREPPDAPEHAAP